VRPFALALALSAAPLAASAQGWSVSRYAAPPSGDDLNATERALVTPHLRVGALVAVDWAHALAVVPIEQRLTAHLAVSLGLFDRAQIAAVMPVVLTQQINGASGPLAPGDLRLDARVRVLGPARRGSGRLALAATLLVPTGDGGANAGDGSVGVIPRVIVELTNARDFVFAANLGVALRPGWENQVVARMGVTIPVTARVLVAVEAGLETLLRDPVANGALSLELLGGLHHVSRGGLALGVAAGPRLLDGEGSADVRVVGLVGYAPQPAEAVVAPRDRDGDGVADADDLCPDVSAGARPDGRRRGCPHVDMVEPPPRVVELPPEPPPNPDRDGDGIANASDACPDEAGTASGDPATHGCPRVFVTAERVVIQQQPRFDVDDASILPESVALMMEVAAAIEAHPEIVRLEIQGHTDDRAGRAYNRRLSQRRAESIRAWLIGRGIAESRLVARGYDWSRPLASNRTAAGRAINRRVEFVVLERGER
jgi:outer membrane protein OmpA-like peptidoglycan-associated protein